MFSHLFTSAWLFDTALFTGISRSDRFFYYFSLILVVAGFILVAAVKKAKVPIRKNLLRQWRALTFTIGIFGLIWAFLRYQYIQYLSAHLVIVLIYLIGVAWAFNILTYYFGKYKERLKAYQAEQQRKKYI